MSDKPWPDPPELAREPKMFRLGYRRARDDATPIIARLSEALRVQALMINPGMTHEQITEAIERLKRGEQP